MKQQEKYIKFGIGFILVISILYFYKNKLKKKHYNRFRIKIDSLQ